MSLRQALSRLASAWAIAVVIICPDLSFADRVVLVRSTAFGRVISISNDSVTIAKGCSGSTTSQVKWKDIDELGGVIFDKTCDPKSRPPTFGGPAPGSGPTLGVPSPGSGSRGASGPKARWFEVRFSDGSSLWAEDIKLGTDGVLWLKVAKGGGAVRGPRSAVTNISRASVEVDTIDPGQFGWPASFQLDK